MAPVESTADPAIERTDDLLIPVGEETVAATRYSPQDTDGPVPALLMFLPYRRGDFSYAGYDPMNRYLAAHGYEVVTADIIGTGASSGRKPEPFTADEGPQGAEIIEWLADQDWTNGRIGMYGLSYGGETTLRAAAERPAPLEAIVPIHATHTMYRAHTHGGAAELYRMAGGWGPMMQVQQAMPPSPRDTDGRWAEVWEEHLAELREGTPWLFQLVEHDTRDAYWQGEDIPVDRIDVPTFAMTGWRDLFTTATMEYFPQLGGEKRLLLGPWRHNLPYAGRESAVDLRRQMVEWFDYFLKDADNDALDHPTIEYWTERDGGGTVDGGVWRGREEWPTVDTDPTLSYALTPDGLSETSAYTDGKGVVEREYEYDHTVGAHSTETVIQTVCEPPDTSPDDARSVVFETDPLADPIEITGTGEVTLRVTATTADPNLSVRLIDVSPDGTAHLVTHRELRLSHRNGDSDPESLTPGEEYEVTLPLRPNSHLFEAGHRIRLAISAGLFPGMMPPREQGSFVFHSIPDRPSTLTFPGRVHEDDATFENAIEMTDPDDTMPVTSPLIRRDETDWRTTRSHVDDSVTVTVTSDSETDLPYADSLTWQSETTASVAAADPMSVEISRTITATIDYGSEAVVIESQSRVSQDLIQLETTITIDGTTLFDESWSQHGH
ncbi:MAG: CocE/NonD family hydrolase [Halobacteriales archaeon]